MLRIKLMIEMACVRYSDHNQGQLTSLRGADRIRQSRQVKSNVPTLYRWKKTMGNWCSSNALDFGNVTYTFFASHELGATDTCCLLRKYVVHFRKFDSITSLRKSDAVGTLVIRNFNLSWNESQ